MRLVLSAFFFVFAFFVLWTMGGRETNISWYMFSRSRRRKATLAVVHVPQRFTLVIFYRCALTGVLIQFASNIRLFFIFFVLSTRGEKSVEPKTVNTNETCTNLYFGQVFGQVFCCCCCAILNASSQAAESSITAFAHSTRSEWGNGNAFRVDRAMLDTPARRRNPFIFAASSKQFNETAEVRGLFNINCGFGANA